MICKEKYKTAFLTRCVEKLTSPRVYEWWYWIYLLYHEGYNVSITNHTNLIKIRPVNPLLYDTLLHVVSVWHIVKELLCKSSFNYHIILESYKKKKLVHIFNILSPFQCTKMCSGDSTRTRMERYQWRTLRKSWGPWVKRSRKMMSRPWSVNTTEVVSL